MLKKIIEFSLKNKYFILITTGIVSLLGLYCMVTLPVDAVPDITNNQVQVVTVSPNLSPQEVEKLITFPIEISMSNILNVTEIRSVSRYGLSVVTVVFKDDVPTLDARQLVNEQLQTVMGEIPPGLGNPELMPITTGLGEIFQYTLDVAPGYEDKYDPMELRTIQDWIVKRNLSGIPGVVEISSFGGYLKQYEVAVDPNKMRSLNVTISEVYDALSNNNQNSGGSYIEKYNSAYYIRSEGMIQNLSDIETIVVANRSGIPICIRDLGSVRFSSAKRFGAMTKNGKGECVGGITLMLKGANANQVMGEIQNRIEKVNKMLPEGVSIKAYLDRSALVNRNIGTVIKNLIEGAIIVFLVLMFFLGNIRAGLIVASTIPLAMLFSFILMRVFNVSANLMSLGAVDFGIIIDGSIVIVESILAHLHLKFAGRKLTDEEMKTAVYKSSREIAQSAAFAVLIILIVFFPILTLTGIEGKTFKPMAQVLIFAIVGALILSMTYIPLMCSLFLNKKIHAGENFSDRMISRLQKIFRPTLELAIKFKYLTLSAVATLFLLAIFLFTRMGGEFLPNQDEGDFAVQMSLPPGSSLTESIEIATRAERHLLENIPEVKEVISKIGTAEVPTDPMGIEDADIMVIMKPAKEWKTTEDRIEMASLISETLAEVPGATFNISQPIQLRFNELMTGSKSDIAVKIYGEDMDELFAQANEAAKYIQRVHGATDVKVEQVIGLPQLIIRFDRDKIARHGLNIDELNATIRAAYAGETAGVVYENERQFDLVIRFNQSNINELDLNKLFVRTPADIQIPMSEVAKVEFVKGPMLINRDMTQRRIAIGVNVRGGDVEGVVKQIDDALTQHLKLKPGYYIEYGGQFENLRNAKQRLAIAIPAALMLILLLLFFAFRSFKYTFLIFITVPLSAIGGILGLYLRGMPFSITAGVGFIALFGVAVLNGIVLINHYEKLRKEQKLPILKIVTEGTVDLLRAVLLTGFVAALGFIPMAISTSAGAEVQRPLATVVIGGLILSTLLTLVVIPILYLLANTLFKKFNV